jgi:predicted dienelactone hydrolase
MHRRSLTLAALGAVTVALLTADVAAAWKPRVGHTVQRTVVAGSGQGETRPVDVHLWYPADHKRLHRHPRTVYTSALYGRPLIPELWDPLTWTVGAEVAREGAPIERRGRRLPVIVFSHGSENEPIDYAHTFELIAAAGFVVAAPTHVNNTQDDVRTDFINEQAGFPLIPCRDGRPEDCSRAEQAPNVEVSSSLAERVRDISKVLDELPRWLGHRVDTSRAGVMGHSRGTVTALAAAGGSAARTTDALCQPASEDPRCWPLDAEPRIAALMGLAIGGPRVTGGAALENVTVPTLLVAGALDRTTPPSISQTAFDTIPSRHKELVVLENAVHRSFDSTYCDQTQAAGAIAQANPRAILDRHTFEGIALRVGMSGRATEYCDYETFTQPVDIRPLVREATGFEVTEENVPSTGLDSDEVKHRMAWLAARFFGKALKH